MGHLSKSNCLIKIRMQIGPFLDFGSILIRRSQKSGLNFVASTTKTVLNFFKLLNFCNFLAD